MKKYLILSLLVLLIVFVFAGCLDNKVEETKTTAETTTEGTTILKTETTTEEVTEAETTTKPAPETTKKQEYVPVETTKKVTTKAPETTKKQESEPVKDEVNDFDTGKLPTYADGSINFGAIDNDKIEEENGGIVYF